ncbi:Putative serine/threonine-protein kinase/receptor R826 [Auxenochlorella protothecoides]|uniref:Putative serine/threonine-protein kinase/receptor R826 n=1 Tax=Auxenochlorella protothecoides TaxID=3075 RepID=A0A087SEH2_AUXPR|nr:Putative serine/threonine-protein kinase/receptor R826 [Auxenochlorella protothecoides]KFM24126.1 Putative serine/threonine-protein kinase/receptor R826 [Auxenochlorella protothecoides]
MTETRPSTAVRHISAVQRVEELEISLQAAHEVNAHLNGEVEKLTARVTALEGERGAFQQRIHLLSRKLAAARRDAGLANDDPALRAWLPGTAWREAEARAREQGWLVDPREVALGPLLGQGTFGTTHRATWRGAAVAVKRVRVADAEGGAMFLREVAALRRLRHPHALLDVAGGMLALEAADPPVLHRDLKPSNVFLDAHGAAKVADMGLARVLEPGAGGLPDRRDRDLQLHEPRVAMEVGAGTLCPEIPSDCPEELAGLLHAAFHPDPIERPSFGAIVAGMARVVEAEARGGEGGGGGGDWLAQGKWGLPTRLTGLLRG